MNKIISPCDELISTVRACLRIDWSMRHVEARQDDERSFFFLTSYKYVQLDPDYDESDFRTTVILADTLESIFTVESEGRLSSDSNRTESETWYLRRLRLYIDTGLFLLHEQ